MAKTVTIKIDDDTYKKLKDHAEAENRSVSNFIETAALKYIEQIEFTDDFDLEEIMSNTELQKRLRKGSKDAELLRGEFVE